jgi:hypothetical protein
MKVAVFFVIVLCTVSTHASGKAHAATICSLASQPEKFLGIEVETSAVLVAGTEYSSIVDGNCSFRFARGDDYQTFGDLYPIEHDTQWDLMLDAVAKAPCEHLSKRLVKAKFRGHVIRVPATGTIPQDQMPLELVIQSVSEVERLPVQCPTASK